MLGREAERQAEHDAAAKMVVNHGKAGSIWSWLLAQNVKMQFIVVAAVLFLGYAVIGSFLSVTGLRHPAETTAVVPPVPKCENPALTLQERARCIVESDGPIVIGRPGTAAQARASNEAKQEEKIAKAMALNEETTRQRQAARFKALREDFERRMREIGADGLSAKSYNDRQAYYQDTLVVMTEMLQLSNHPMKASFQRVVPGRYVPSEFANVMPAGGEEAEQRMTATCGQLPLTRGRLAACAAALRENVFQLRYSKSRSDLFIVVSPARGD